MAEEIKVGCARPVPRTGPGWQCLENLEDQYGI